MIIKWYDACTKEVDGDFKNVMYQLKDGRELLATNTTYGKLFKVFENVVVIITEESDTDEEEMTFIPRGWIISPKRLFKNITK
jgi:hypothetical protein